ncbi:MAG: hypothetical protein M1819_007147 [Sarea resinae]|nr:MAG: hypothetical protein M1819_007147 [Sarea resinae]
MVRLKNRYLLVRILYPSSSSANANTNTAANSSTNVKSKPAAARNLPPLLQSHHPTPDALTQQLLIRMIRNEVGVLFGDYGVGALGAGGLAVKYLSPATSTAIIRCPRAHYRLVWVALSFLTSLPAAAGGEKCVFRVVRVSGTVRKAEEEVVRLARLEVLRARREGRDSEGTLGQILGDGNQDRKGSGGNQDVVMIEDDEEDEEEEGGTEYG